MTVELSIHTIQQLDSVLQRRYPDASSDDVVLLREKVLGYVISRIEEGYDLAFIKSNGHQEAILKILKLIEEEG